MREVVYVVKQWDKEDDSCYVCSIHRTKQGAHDRANDLQNEYDYSYTFWVDRYELDD